MTKELTEAEKQLIHEEVKEYLASEVVRYSEEYKEQIEWTIAEYFYHIEKILKDEHSDCDSLEVGSFEGPMRAMYILVQCVLEEVLPKVYLKPEWVRETKWQKMLNKKENTND